ncbi:GNAT family N-acetyltransferase [Bacillaceae bacterium IKA-2]|nr:GNAT family N-acetyltransferase [Bacillaceae bacterium IKA-2]
MKELKSVKFEDIIECSKLYVNVFNKEPWNDDWTIETANIRLKDIYNSPNFEGVLYIEEGVIRGAILGNYEQFYDGIHFILKEMFICNELQGKGIGSKMIEQFEKELLKNQVTTIVLFTSKGDRTFSFYSKNGFEEFKSMAMMGKKL